MAQGSFGRIRVFEDFIGGLMSDTSALAMTADKAYAIGQLWFTSLNEGTFSITTDEPGGVLAITSDTGDNDNVVLFVGPFQPADGGCVMECRFKIDDVDDIAIFVGFSETLEQDGTPVLPASATGANPTVAIAGTGGVAGLLHDADATTNDWRAVAGDGGVAASDMSSAYGARANAAPVNDEYDVVRVEMDVNGDAKVYHDGKLIDDIAKCVTAGDNVYAILMAEVREAGGAQKLEVDYFYAEGNRDWTV